MDIPGTALYVPAGTRLEERPVGQHQPWESELRGELRLVGDFSPADHRGADLLPHVGELGTAVRQVQREDGDFLGRPDLLIGGHAADDWASCARQDLAERRFDRTHVSQFWNP